MSEKKFPLIIWETTPEYKQEFEVAKQRFDALMPRLRWPNFECTYLGFEGFDLNGIPSVWLNSNGGFYKPNTSDDALKYAFRHGDCCRWTLDQLEEFALQKKGSILESAMWRMGYRYGKKDNSKWVKIKKGDEQPRYEVEEKVEKIEGTELERLSKIVVMPNVKIRFDETHYLTVGSKGMVYAGLHFNPMFGGSAEAVGSYYGSRQANKAHFAIQQNGFRLDAKNIILGEDRMVYVKAIRTLDGQDGSYVERVWPTNLLSEKIIDVAEDLVSKVNAE